MHVVSCASVWDGARKTRVSMAQVRRFNNRRTDHAYHPDHLQRTQTTQYLSGPMLAQSEATDYTRDHANRLTEQRTTLGPEGSQSVHHTRYTFDAAGRLTSRTSQITASGAAEPSITQRYHYNEVDRLSRIEYLQNAGLPSEQLLEQIDYMLDARGQRIAKTTLNNHGAGVNDTPMTATYDAANRMQSITLRPSADASTHKTYNLTYDANGNLIEKVNAANASERTTYTWDAQDKLIALSQTSGEGGVQAVQASYQYDLFGRRIGSSIQVGAASAQNPAQTVQYLYEGQQALGEIRSQRLSHRLITGLGLDETIARIAIAGTGAADTQASRQYLTDALNSVIAQANAQGGAIANSYGYSPYGESSTIGPDATGNTSQYTSRENDAQGASGLYFYRARYYDPVLKRFISEDPIGLAGGDNVYAYVEANPLSYVDPTGLTASLDPWFGHGGDQGFKDWWHAKKGPGWFSSDMKGFNPKFPYDIPNKEICDLLKADYDAEKAEEEARKQQRKSNGPRPQRQRGDKKPSLNDILRRGGRGGGGRGGNE